MKPKVDWFTVITAVVFCAVVMNADASHGVAAGSAPQIGRPKTAH
jgi:hypothetical protein